MIPFLALAPVQSDAPLRFDWLPDWVPQDWIDHAIRVLAEHGLNVLGAIAIFVIGRWVLGWVVRLVRGVLTRKNFDPTLTGFLANILRMAGLALVVTAAVNELGIDTTSFAAVLGAAVFAVGFALQGSLANFAAGVMIIFFRPFKVGDYVEGGGTAGIIEEITVFSTFLRTPDNKRVIVPNASITGGNIVNYSAKDTRRVDLVFGISYDDDVAAAREVIARVLAEDERILKDPEPIIGLLALADSSVNIACRPWVRTADYWPVLFDLNERMKGALEGAGMTIPFPQRDVHLHQIAS